MSSAPIEEVAARVVGWWLDVERLTWDRDTGVVRAPIEAAETKVRFGIGSSKAPDVFGHELVIRHVVDLALRHDGDYPFAQAVDRLSFDDARGEIVIQLSADSLARVRVEAPEVELLALAE